MRSRFDQSSEAAYAYYGGMLNAGYVTGFARKKEAGKFVVQQTNDSKIALPVYVEGKGVSLPKDTDPVKVIGRFIGSKTESGHRIVNFRAITLDRPSIRELPNRLAWEKPLPNPETDSFKPFFDPHDDEEVGSIFAKGEKRNGRPCVNVARLAGFVESFAYKPQSSPGKRDDCLLVALRQTENPDECIPIRIYGRFADGLRKTLQIALPIMLEGFYRVKRENHGTAEAPVWVFIPYIHCSNIKVATPDDIKVRPAWWQEMADRLLQTTRNRLAAAGHRLPEAEVATPKGKKAKAEAAPADAAASPAPAPVASEIREIKGL